MAEKRKDSRGRILRTGESQRPDGRYSYIYTDIDGKRKMVYSWTLTATDRTPVGKKKGASLREKEQEIEKCLMNGFIAQSSITVAQVAHDYVIKYKSHIKKSSRKNFDKCFRILDVNPIGKKNITSVGRKEAKDFIYWIMTVESGYSAAVRVKNLLCAAYEQAIDDEVVSKNPFSFRMFDRPAPAKKRDAIPDEIVSLFTEFTDRPMYSRTHDIFIILLETGLRISELLGLRTDDINLEAKTLSVNHQLLYNVIRKDGEDVLYVETPKSNAGNRTLFLSDKAVEAFRSRLKKREELLDRIETQPVIDGYTNFIFLCYTGSVAKDTSVRISMRHAVRACEEKTGVKMPEITPHIIRHTFCTRLINGGLNPKSVQYLMGHSDVNMTLNVYSHINQSAAIEEMKQALAQM